MSADFCSPLPRQVALPTEAWRGAEICRHLAENVYVDLPGPVEHLTHNPKIGGSNPTIDTGREKMEKKSMATNSRKCEQYRAFHFSKGSQTKLKGEALYVWHPY